jgi:hypothetical protein
MSKQQRRVTAEQADEIRQRHRAGESIYVLGTTFGIAPQTVARILSYEIHRPRDRRVVPVLLTRRDFALLALLAEESGLRPMEMAALILSRGLAAA